MNLLNSPAYLLYKSIAICCINRFTSSYRLLHLPVSELMLMLCY